MDTSASSLVRPENAQHDPPLRIMIIDSHEIFRYGLRNVLAADGFTVVSEVSSCREALSQLARISPDVVLQDMSLPDADGITAAKQIMASLPSLKVVILSEVMNDDDLLAVMQIGASGYLTKDIPARDVMHALQHIREGEFALTHPVANHLIRLLLQKCLKLENVFVAHVYPRTTVNTASAYTPAVDETFVVTGTLTDAMYTLTRQEWRVCQYMRQGLSNKQIAARLSISPYTVGKHVQHVLRKLGAVNRTQVASYSVLDTRKGASTTTTML